MSLLKEQRLSPMDELSPEHTSLIAHEQRIKKCNYRSKPNICTTFSQNWLDKWEEKVIEEGERLLKLEVRRVMEVVSR